MTASSQQFYSCQARIIMEQQMYPNSHRIGLLCHMSRLVEPGSLRTVVQRVKSTDGYQAPMASLWYIRFSNSQVYVSIRKTWRFRFQSLLAVNSLQLGLKLPTLHLHFHDPQAAHISSQEGPITEFFMIKFCKQSSQFCKLSFNRKDCKWHTHDTLF